MNSICLTFYTNTLYKIPPLLQRNSKYLAPGVMIDKNEVSYTIKLAICNIYEKTQKLINKKKNQNKWIIYQIALYKVVYVYMAIYV